MRRAIAGFHRDEQGHWVAELECGHEQHMRHHPPWQSRPWTLTAEGREEKVGVDVDCLKCDRGEPRAEWAQG